MEATSSGLPSRFRGMFPSKAFSLTGSFSSFAREKLSRGRIPGCLTSSRDEYRFESTLLGDGDFGAEVDVLDGVEELDAFVHGALEGFAAGDEAGAAGALIDDGGGYGFS